jgi:4-amino-4-deoxy-L-arabinose transferase-like glycosyltransferase
MTLPAATRAAAFGLLAFLCILAVSSVGIGRMTVIDRDEARFAQASKQMAQTGDYIDIRLQDAPRYQKPVGIYWLHNAATHAMGVPGSDEIWHYRVVSVLAAALCVLALAWAGAPLVGAGPALLAGIALATTVVLQIEARIAKTDAALLLTIILAMGALARAALGKVRGRVAPAVFWAAIGAGVLIKGPLILGPVAGAALWVSVARRELRWLGGLRSWPGALGAAAIILPWYVAITVMSGGAFWSMSLGGDFAAKIASAQESHAAPPGAYLLGLLVTGWPWVVLLPLAAAAAWRLRAQPEVQVLLGWLLPFWLVLEAVPTKLPHYTLPTYPALMLLAVMGLMRLGPLRGWGWAAGGLFWLVGAAVLAAFVVALPIVYGAGLHMGTLLGVALALGLGGLGLWRLRGAGPERLPLPLLAMAAGAVAMVWTLVAVAIPAARDLLISERVAALTACHDGPVIVAGYGEPSIPFLMGTDVALLDPEAARAALEATPGALAWLPVEGSSPQATGEGVRVTGTNYSNGREVALQLHLHPGIPAEAPPCR